MMRLAYQLLEQDPAYMDQKEYFPTIDGILEWEGVVAKTDRVIMEGGEWRGKGKSGGPDAAGKSKDSYHYYNALLAEGQRGNVDTSVERHFKELLLQMYSQGDFFNRDKPNNDTNHNAAWAAHYLGDAYVPYHSVGRFTAGMKVGKLTPAEAGPAYLYDYKAAELAGAEINPDSIVQPPDWYGNGNDFSDIYSYYMTNHRTNEDKDWFDPWYYNGPYWYNGIKGLGPNAVLGSHQSWEGWAHTYITDNNLAKVPTAYSEDWKNAIPKFNSALSNIENQAAMARDFTIASAKETVNNMAVFTKKPDVAFNKAAERVATLWRASITALRPEIKVTPDTGNPKLLKVTATIKSLEPKDPAVNVKAKLTVEGGTIRGEAIHNADNQGRVATGKPIPGSYNKPDTVESVKVTPGHPWVTEWQVDSDNPDACKFQMEVICEYQKTPDLQYAVCEAGKPLSVTISPDQVEAKDKVTLTVKVEPAQKVELEIKDWGPLKAKQGKLSTDKNGVFKGDFNVKDGTASGTYDISVSAPKLNQEGTASFRVGKIDLSWAKQFRIIIGVEASGHKVTPGMPGIRVDEVFTGSFTGNTFHGALQPRDGYVRTGTTTSFTGTGTVTISVEPTDTETYFKVTNYSMELKSEHVTKSAPVTTTYIYECSLSGPSTADSRPIPIGENAPKVDEYGWWNEKVIGGADVRSNIDNIKITTKISAKSGKNTTETLGNPTSNQYSFIVMGFSK